MKKQEKNKKTEEVESGAFIEALSEETLKVIYETNYSQLNKMLDSITDMDRKLTSVIAIDSIALPLIIGNIPALRSFNRSMTIFLIISLISVVLGFFFAVYGLLVKVYKDSPDPEKLYDYYYYEDVKKLYMDGARNFAEKYSEVKKQSNRKRKMVNVSFSFSCLSVILAIFVIFASKIF